VGSSFLSKLKLNSMGLYSNANVAGCSALLPSLFFSLSLSPDVPNSNLKSNLGIGGRGVGSMGVNASNLKPSLLGSSSPFFSVEDGPVPPKLKVGQGPVAGMGTGGVTSLPLFLIPRALTILFLSVSNCDSAARSTRDLPSSFNFIIACLLPCSILFEKC
jgi:hypothetical protein